MNYRHAYHAGNMGDVLKHVVLARVLAHLALKPAPFRVIDTHAGIGLYDLAGEEASKTGEWQAGVGRLWDDRPAGAVGETLAPWYAVLDALNPDGRLRFYPGSPEIVARSLRKGDKAVLFEKHPEDGATLARRFKANARVDVQREDGWKALEARLPPPERRGAILVDPPFEAADEYVRLTAGLAAATRRFATGTYLLWYPVKGTDDVKGLTRALVLDGPPRTLRIELHTRTPNHPSRLDGAGLIVVNPPWTLASEMESALPVLATRLATGPGAGGLVEWIKGE